MGDHRLRDGARPRVGSEGRGQGQGLLEGAGQVGGGRGAGVCERVHEMRVFESDPGVQGLFHDLRQWRLDPI